MNMLSRMQLRKQACVTFVMLHCPQLPESIIASKKWRQWLLSQVVSQVSDHLYCSLEVCQEENVGEIRCYQRREDAWLKDTMCQKIKLPLLHIRCFFSILTLAVQVASDLVPSALNALGCDLYHYHLQVKNRMGGMIVRIFCMNDVTVKRKNKMTGCLTLRQVETISSDRNGMPAVALYRGSRWKGQS